VAPDAVQSLRHAGATNFKEARYAGQRGCDHADALYDAYKAIGPAIDRIPVPAKADAGDVPGKTAGGSATIKDHPSGCSIWQAFANLYGNGNLDNEDCAYIDRELVKWRGEKFSAAPAPAAEQGVAVSVEELAYFITSRPWGWDAGRSIARALLDKYSIRSAMMTEGE
jgi:hypothetical protein